MSEIRRYYPSDMQLNLGKPRVVFTEHSSGQICMYEDVEPTIQRNAELEQRNKELEAELAQIRERKKISVGAMVAAFLGWKLPTDFSPDAGISFDSEYGEKWGMPTGTNLLHAGQARQMVEHILCGCEPTPAQVPAELVEWANSWQEDDSDMPSYLVGCNDMKHFVKSQLEKRKGGA
jgi:hypothetical protein